MRFMLLTGFITGSLFATGCASTVSEAKMAVKSDADKVQRQDALNVMADAICKRYEDCNQLGHEKKYSTRDDCVAKERATWAGVWSEDKCGEPKQLVVGKVKECQNRAGNWACGDNVLDFGGLVSECAASDVCK